MPDTGYDPYGGWDTGAPIDNSGGGIDPSYAYALAAGGDFPGAQQNSLGYRAGASIGTNAGNPDYNAPAFLAWLASHAGASGSVMSGLLSRLVSAHQSNVRSPGAGQDPQGLSGGYPYNFFSGPGASYGPADGPGTGLVDFGRGVNSQWDMPESKPPGQSTSGAPGKGKGGGGGGGHVLNWSPYGGIPFQSSFVDYQPIRPGTPGPYEPTRFVSGGRAATPSPAATPAPGGNPPRGGAGRGAGPGGGAGGGPGAGRGSAGGGTGRGGAGGGITPPTTTGWNPGDPWVPGFSPLAVHPGEQARDNAAGGVDTSNLDRGTPSWARDPTTGTQNTSGMPLPTLPAPQLGETFDAYMTRLHDAGFNSDDISSILGRYGYQQDASSPGGMGPGAPTMNWDWGTGPVVRGDGGYSFANSGARGGPGGGSGAADTPDALNSLLIPLY